MDPSIAARLAEDDLEDCVTNPAFEVVAAIAVVLLATWILVETDIDQSKKPRVARPSSAQVACDRGSRSSSPPSLVGGCAYLSEKQGELIFRPSQGRVVGLQQRRLRLRRALDPGRPRARSCTPGGCRRPNPTPPRSSTCMARAGTSPAA